MISLPVTAVPQRWRCGRHSVIVKNVDYLQSWPCEHNKDIIPIDTRRFLSSLVSRIMLCTSYDLPLSFESTVSPNSSTMWWKMNGQTMVSFPSTHLTSSIDTKSHWSAISIGYSCRRFFCMQLSENSLTALEDFPNNISWHISKKVQGNEEGARLNLNNQQASAEVRTNWVNILIIKETI